MGYKRACILRLLSILFNSSAQFLALYFQCLALLMVTKN